MDNNPFICIKLRQAKTDREFLFEHELTSLVEKEFEIERLDLVRDAFVFYSFTGLSFSDIKELTLNHIFCDDEGAYWIRNLHYVKDSENRTEYSIFNGYFCLN